jgi:hypothetical protein
VLHGPTQLRDSLVLPRLAAKWPKVVDRND